MKQLNITFKNEFELFQFLENIANAQHDLADKAEQNGSDSKTMFSIMALARVQAEALKQLSIGQMANDKLS